MKYNYDIIGGMNKKQKVFWLKGIQLPIETIADNAEILHSETSAQDIDIFQEDEEFIIEVILEDDDREIQ